MSFPAEGREIVGIGREVDDGYVAALVLKSLNLTVFQDKEGLSVYAVDRTFSREICEGFFLVSAVKNEDAF